MPALIHAPTGWCPLGGEMLKVLQGVRSTALFLSSEGFCEMLAGASYTNISAFLQEQLRISKSTVWIVEINLYLSYCISIYVFAVNGKILYKEH